MFCFLNGQNFWALDDVSVTDLTTNTDCNKSYPMVALNSTVGAIGHLSYNSIYRNSRDAMLAYGSAMQVMNLFYPRGQVQRSGIMVLQFDVQYTRGDGIYQYVTTVVWTQS